jgi:hypothetical protein
VSARGVVLGVLGVFLLLVGGLLAIPLVVERGGDIPALPAEERIQAFAGEAGGLRVSGALRLRATAFDLQVHIQPAAAAEAGPPPQAVLTMPDHPMEPVVALLLEVDPGRFTAAGELPMPGRWRLEVAVAGESVGLVFDAVP